jgi:hypothetical protein
MNPPTIPEIGQHGTVKIFRLPRNSPPEVLPCRVIGATSQADRYWVEVQLDQGGALTVGAHLFRPDQPGKD